MQEINAVEALESAGLKPIVIDENTDFDEVFAPLLKRETNSEFIDRILNVGCPTGALVQAFVLEALFTYSDGVVKKGCNWSEDNIISPKAWMATAEWVKAELDKKYGKP